VMLEWLPLIGNSSTAERLTLDQKIGVRIPVPELGKIRKADHLHASRWSVLLLSVK
jgi:hypothetical protein